MKHLSPREQEVLIEASWGLTARQSAEDLRLAVSTVKTHRQHICLKLQVPNIAAAVAVAMREGEI
jgi:two-component system nitrate/nitrite response regulator NarL